MKCPVCKTVDLVMSDRNGIEIDYCPQCRGVWLDRGELDKIIERSAPVTASHAAYAPPVQQPVYGNHHQQQQQRHHDPHYGHHKKREGFWGELFDFD
ncbi:MAG: zf-TFIIB domain-containing protein [Thiothrix sp.]|uniref:TFIIB-type zinc ribbon-containing protein n=1 Tax=Thiothrix sp. TaxID=1032 RepID=UPI00260416F8|nr:zf-TFIIB domain-containing protein [Thiothrix sp.]MDD5395307.1 zf-TFIIB domain-containing protein [Thiothrix sp.]